MIVYRNPLEQWFWEDGWRYVGSITLLFAALFIGVIWWGEYKAKRERKKRWLEMNETQRNAWRHFYRRNNLEAKEWEKC
jgi:hypothetical protein